MSRSGGDNGRALLDIESSEARDRCTERGAPSLLMLCRGTGGAPGVLVEA